jgi:bacterial/archaeal transporter family-2 protein
MPRFVFLALALLIGAALPIQAGVNAQLRYIVGSPLRSALANFAVGLIALVVLVLVTGGDQPALRQSSWWMWVGGLLGAAFVTGTVVLAPRLGATALVGAIVAGQLAAAVLIDHFGLVGYRVVPASWTRIAGVALLFLGVLLIQRR